MESNIKYTTYKQIHESAYMWMGEGRGWERGENMVESGTNCQKQNMSEGYPSPLCLPNSRFYLNWRNSHQFIPLTLYTVCEPLVIWDSILDSRATMISSQSSLTQGASIRREKGQLQCQKQSSDMIKTERSNDSDSANCFRLSCGRASLRGDMKPSPDKSQPRDSFKG